MKRKDFLRNSAGLLAGSAVFPYLLPTGRLFAPTGQRIANHVVFVMFAGGIRNLESVHKAEGNLMPNLLPGSESISSDIASAMSALPTGLVDQPLLTKGTLFKELRYADGPAGHFQGNLTALTGNYVSNNVNFTNYTERPSLFEYYRKHNSPQQAATNAWWVSLQTGENEFLSYSSHADYGRKYAGNFISPNNLLWNYDPIDLCRTFLPSEKEKIAAARNLLNSAYNKPLQLNDGINTPEQFEQIQIFLNQIIGDYKDGSLYNDWAGVDMNGDMHNIMMAEQVLKTFKPELLVVNMTETDTCHRNFTEYCDNLRKADYATAHLWNTIQSTPGLADDTIMVIMPEHGRDLAHNTIIDQYGRFGIDHGGDEVSEEVFCMILGPQGKVYQNNVITSVTGQCIDAVPTIAHILGFWENIPSGLLPGSPLYQAFV
jgi:hypothetical protein